MQPLEAVNTTFDSPLLMKLARDAQRRCSDELSFDAIAAIVLAYSAFESFINELGQLAETVVYETDHADENPMLEREDGELVETLRPLASTMREAIERHVSPEERYDLAWRAFTGEEPDRGKGTR